jgi:hypothetical protein
MKKHRFDNRRCSQGTVAPLIKTMIMLGFLLFPSTGQAGLILDAEIRLTYEDNVIGILSDQNAGQIGQRGGMSSAGVMQAGGPGGGGKNLYTGMSTTTSGSTGDLSGTVSAAIGGYSDAFSDSTIFIKGFAERISYDTYQDLDATIGGVSTGITTQLSKSITARLSLIGKVKHFQDSQRSGNSYGGEVGLKEKLTQDLWFRQFAEYEKNGADSTLFRYAGIKTGIRAGYDLTRTTVAAVGYTYLVQDFDEPAGAVLRTGMAFVTVEQALSRTWFLSAEYALQSSRDSTSGTDATNNVYSLALRYSY